MNDSFGIDHPLIAVRNLESVRKTYEAIGFRMTPIGKHPWGTNTSLAMFEGCLLELMGVYDPALLDVSAVGEFRFGRHVAQHLTEREGIALQALHSVDAEADAARAAKAGLTCPGTIEFGRDVVLPDGAADRTRTTLKPLPDARFPRLSFFLCQQHRPDLIYVPEWLEHPNGTVGINGVTILANEADHGAIADRLIPLYGPASAVADGFEVKTANGPFRILTPNGVETAYRASLEPLNWDGTPSPIAVDLRCRTPDTVLARAAATGLAHQQIVDGVVIADLSRIGNVLLRFRSD
ncbi:MAG: VOC family protein [Pseudomonadota bacterium]